MAASKGRLYPEDEKKIQKNYQYLLHELEANDLIDVMFSEFIFDQDCLDEIKNALPNTRKKRMEVFLDKLMFSGEKGYKVFLEVLQKTYPHVAKKLENTYISGFESERKDYPEWFNDIPEERKNEKISEQDLSRLVQHLGEGWELVAIDLKITQAQIDQGKMNASSSHVKMFNVFNKWRQRQGTNAKFAAFIKALYSAKCTVHWDGIKNVMINEA